MPMNEEAGRRAASGEKGSPHSYTSFDDWYQEDEGFSLRAERLKSDPEELRAAFEAGRNSTQDVCHKCGSISGVYLQVCDGCMTHFNKVS